jgi:hypothetical protein
VVAFEVGGVIDLAGTSLRIANPYIYIAGQTAPSPGITLIRGGISIESHDIAVRHIAVRPGDNDRAPLSGWEIDGVTTWKAWNVLIDHCSCTWATDENISVSGPQFDGADATSHCITLSNNINAEALRNSAHSKGAHAYGTLVNDYCTDVAVVGNLYASNQERNPLVKPNVSACMAGNLLYNPSRRGIHASWPADEYAGRESELREATISAVGNICIPGPDTPAGLYLIYGRMKVYHSDNAIYRSADDPSGDRDYVLSPASQGTRQLATSPSAPTLPGYAPLPSSQVLNSVRQNAGARPWDRSPTDSRIIGQIATRGGKVIDSQREVEDYPSPLPTSHTLTIPATGVEQWTETFEN